MTHLRHSMFTTPRQSSANAAVGGFKPLPQGGSKGPTFISHAAPPPEADLHQAPFNVRDTRKRNPAKPDPMLALNESDDASTKHA